MRGGGSSARRYAEPASEAFGDDRGHICLGKTLKLHVRLLRVDHRIDRHKGVCRLGNAVVDPWLIPFLRRTPVTLVGSVKALLARPHHHCSDLQHRATIGATARYQRPIVAVDFIEMIDNGVAVDQRFAAVEHQRRDAASGLLARTSARLSRPEIARCSNGTR
jgi:hypothetical protein